MQRARNGGGVLLHAALRSKMQKNAACPSRDAAFRRRQLLPPTRWRA